MSECDRCGSKESLLIYKLSEVIGHIDTTILDDIRLCTECYIRALIQEREELVQIGDVDDLEEVYGDTYKEREE